ncbi:MAG: carbohydrate binding family 9 domain-containing protein [Bacteroidales bacterium]|nr:carbohydrate binding family 9 domain-containing protein [Bacteroidales bacterium]
MIRNLTLFALLLSVSASVLFGQTEYLPKKKYKAFRLEVSPDIDGVFDDEAWQNGNWAGDFTQHEPYADRAPLQQTEFKVAFDDMNFYVAIRALDSAPDSITNRMSRRDNGDGDMVFIIFDSYHDLRTGFVFGVSSAGVRFDMVFSNNGQSEDATWDPIWQAKSQVHEWGWGAEMKIPLTQLRFNRNSEEVWGFEVARQIFRNNELSFWHPIPRNAPGIIHAMGELDGLQEMEPRKQLDLMPYSVASIKTYEPEEGNPYLKGTDPGFNIGLDGKMGVTNNLTLDFTINPDFGQVEADPSEVNLSAFETFFEEKRPFFIEGNNITSFNVGLGDGDVGNDNLFYSRRIGRRPHGDPSLDDGEYVNVPIFTRILGATKLTGKTENGLSIGIVEAITADTRATIDNQGDERRETVEPMTNYSLARVQKDFNQGNSILGGAATSTIRKLDGTDLDYLHKNATTAGIDFTQYLKERNYTLGAALYLSNVQGSVEAISETQQSSARYFQRPDADYVEYDSTRTSLSGLGGKLEFGKIGGNWNFMFMNVFKSPGLELNDMGYMRQADNILNVLWTGYSFTEPFSIFRSLNLNHDVWVASNFGGRIEGIGYEYNVNANFRNYWNGGFGGGLNFHQAYNGTLRGGPTMYMPNSGRFRARLSSDERKAFSAELSGSVNWGAEKHYISNSYELEMTIRPINTLTISLSPSYTTNIQELQYVSTLEMNSDDRYVFGHLDQKVLSMSLRINYSITPDLTIQYWGQPFTASGDYTGFKMITDPKADEFTDRYHVYTTQQISPVDDTYEIDENYDMIKDYSFENPNFTVNEWLSNLVIRWEFLPGSTGYLVWSQTRDYNNPNGSFEVWDNMNNMFTDKKATNTFLVKFSYRFGLR